MFKTISLAALAALVAALPARADNIAPCTPPAGVAATALTLGQPPIVPAGLRPIIAGMALPGQAFDSTDVVVTGNDRRLIFIWRRASRWLIAFEQGGFVYNDPVKAYELSSDGGDARLTGETLAGPATVCRAARDLISAKAR